MGTNYYAKRIITEEEYKEMERALSERNLEELQTLLSNYTNERTYHIGKRSYGWQFLFSPCPWERTLDSIKSFLAQDDIEIYDEYGEKFTCDEFWEEINYCLYNDPDKHINGFQYNEMERRDGYKDSFNTGNYEFINDEGIRFANTPDFS